jgi:hypothetical protein
MKNCYRINRVLYRINRIFSTPVFTALSAGSACPAPPGRGPASTGSGSLRGPLKNEQETAAAAAHHTVRAVCVDRVTAHAIPIPCYVTEVYFPICFCHFPRLYRT